MNNNNDEKPIGFTAHAKERLKERKISKEDAIKVIRKGKAVRYHEKKKIFYYYSNIVVFEEKDDSIQVITVYKSNKTLEQKIEKIPDPYEWIKQADKETFINQAYFLSEKGLSDDEIIEHLDIVFRAVCGEYGE